MKLVSDNRAVFNT